MVSMIKKTGDTQPALYKPNLKVIVSDPALASLPDNDPLKQSKNIELGDILPLAKEWNITPIVSTETVNPSITESINCTVDNQTGLVTFDTTNAPAFTGSQAVFHTAVAKTNIDLASLTDGSATFLGLETPTINSNAAASLIGYVVAKPGLTPTQVASSVNNIFLGASNTVNYFDDFIIALAGKYATEPTSLVQMSIRNDINNTQPTPTTLTQIPSASTLVGSGKRLSLLLNKETDSLAVGFAVSTADETSFDVADSLVIADNPTLGADSEVYVIMLGLNFGGGYPSLAVKPVTVTGKDSYNVAGTSYISEAGKTQQDWDTAFPHPFTSLTSTVYTDMVFPENIYPGVLLKTIVDAGYSSNYIPKPYGKEVTSNSLVIVTNTTSGAEDFIAFSNKESLIALQAAITNNSNEITQLSAAVSAAAKLADLSEIIIYVTGNLSSPIITASSVFNTFDEAYEHALTLPGFLKKRIILDDRFSQAYDGEVNTVTFIPKKYMLMTYNITLSTLSTYTDGNLTDNIISFRAYCDGLRLIDFEGHLQSFVADTNLPPHHVVDLSDSIAPSLGARFNYDNFIIGNNTKVYSDSTSVLDLNGGTVVLTDNAIWFNEFIDITGTPSSNPIVITKSSNSKLTISGSKQPLTSFTSEPVIQIVTSRKEFPTVNTVTPSNAVSFLYTDSLIPNLFVYDGFTIIRSLDDLILNSNQVNTNAFSLQTGKYWIVGEINIGSNVFFIQTSVTIVGTHGSKIKGLGTIFSDPALDNSNLANTLSINGVDFESDVQSSPTIRVLGNLNIQNSKINSVYPLLVIGSTFLNTVKVKNCSFGSENKPLLTALSITRCKVFIDSIRAYLHTNAKLLSFEGGAVGRLDMNDVVATYEGGQQVNSYLIDIGNLNDFYASGDINISNVEVIPNNSVFEQHRYNLFGTAGSVIDVSDRVRYNVDIFKYYACCKATTTNVSVPVVGQNTLIPIDFTPNSTEGKRGFMINNNLLIYTGKTPTTFTIDALASFTTVQGNALTGFVITKNNVAYESVTLQPSATSLIEQACIKCPVKLKYGDTLGFNVVNADNTNPFTRFRLMVSLTES